MFPHLDAFGWKVDLTVFPVPFQMTAAPNAFLLSRFFFPRLTALVRTRLAICASFFIQGTMYATWCSRIPGIKANLHLDDATLGSLLFLLPIGEFLSIVPNGICVTRFGSRRTTLLAGFLYPAILIALGCATSPLQLALLLFFTGAIANLSNTAVNTQAVQLEQRYGRSIIALFHGMWSIGGLFAVSMELLFAQFHLPILLHFGIMATGAMLLLSFSGGALGADQSTHSPKKPRTATGLKAWHFTPAILWLGIACFGCMACEGTVYNWSNLYLRDALRVEPTHQSLAYFVYLCTMVAGRFIIDTLVNRWGIFRILFISGGMITLGFLLTVAASLLLTDNLPVTLCGFALIGCGTSAVVPLCCGLTSRCKEIPSGIAIAEISTIGFMGLLLAPPLVGYLSKCFNLPIAFLVITIISLPILLAVQRLRAILWKDAAQTP